jgi:ABC-2 type transport system ATP-binding protein
MIHMHNIGFQYGKKPLFNALDLAIQKGNIYGLLGMNGAGKTTLLKILSGQLFPQEGDVQVLGYNPVLRQKAMLEDLFHLPEEFFLPSMRGDQYLTLYAPFYPKFDHTAFQNYCADFGLDLRQKLHELSFGQKKKFLLSFGLASQTALVILDEPTNGLDIPSKSQFRRTVASAMTQERTFIISTHQVRDMENLIDPIIIIHSGRVVLEASLASLAQQFTIEVEKSEPTGSHIIYSEKIPSGWVTMQHRHEESLETPIDLETLFNAVIANPQAFSHMRRETL